PTSGGRRERRGGGHAEGGPAGAGALLSLRPPLGRHEDPGSPSPVAEELRLFDEFFLVYWGVVGVVVGIWYCRHTWWSQSRDGRSSGDLGATSPSRPVPAATA
ncbi:unnamed protein product, partial [Prorocentrum cordatum]